MLSLPLPSRWRPGWSWARLRRGDVGGVVRIEKHRTDQGGSIAGPVLERALERGKHGSTFPRHDAPGSCVDEPPLKQRAQGMPVPRTHPQPCVQVKKARKQVTTGTPK